jgi:glycosyltransferase involved in cell wall biosynthesis
MVERLMRILHIIAGIDPASGGTTTALRNIITMESIHGIEHEILTIQWRVPDSAILEMVSVYNAKSSFPARYARSLDAINWLEQNLRRFDLFIIHGIWSWLPWKVSKVLAAMRKPYIICPHGSLDPFDIQKKRLLKKILGPIFVRGILDRSTAILCTASKEARLVERYGAHPRMESLPLPVPFSARRGEAHRFRSKWGYEGGEFTFLFLSRINYKKGLDILIPAFAKLGQESRKVKLVIAGSDHEGYGVRVKSWIDQWHIRQNVIFAGFLQGEEKDDALAASDCFVLPSLNENFALAVVEALGAGVPVIISENVYIEEEVAQANAGWVCKLSVDSLYDTMKRVILDSTDYTEKRNATIALAQSYSPERIGKLYIKLYTELINNTKK